MDDFREKIINKLSKINPQSWDVKVAIRIFKEGKGVLIGDDPSNIFFWEDFKNDGDACK